MTLKNHIFSYYFFVFPILIHCYSVTDTLKQGHQLNDGEFLISAGRVFTLGFFSPKEQKIAGYFTPESAQNRFIGIWYTYDYDKKPVWVANRNKPIFKGLGSLQIDQNGKLRIIQNDQIPIILNPNQENPNKSTVAVLKDTGNFVLKKLGSSVAVEEEQVLWQSFDYPTDTLLPGMKLGFNFKTGQNWSITSWVNDEVPANGAFTLGIGANPNGKSKNQLVMWRRGKIYWYSGVWNKSKFMNVNDDIYSFDYVSNKDEKYFILSLINNWRIMFPMYKINGEGVISKLDSYFHELVNCHVKSLGCVKQKLPECRRSNSKHQYFERSKAHHVISEGFKYEVQDYILGKDDCEAKCLDNCSCVAFAAIYGNGTGCQFWSDITHISQLAVHEYASRDSDYRDVYIQREYNFRVTRWKRFWWIWFIVGTTSFLLLLSFAWLGYRLRSTLLKITNYFVHFFCVLGNIIGQILKQYMLRLKDHVQRSLKPGSHEIKEEVLKSEVGSIVGNSSEWKRKGKLINGMQMFSLESMVQASDNFSLLNKLGQGGYGIVYKGMLEDEQEVAIKRLSRTSKQGRLEFKNEVTLIANLQHTNLVKLIGCCIEQGEKIVVYEYMHNKSLDHFLFDPSRKSLLDWKKRLNIMEGVAQGLLYLHKFSRMKIIHRDLKAGNILLDQDMNPKVSDFGMAKLFDPNESRANTNKIMGTFGYMPPEYAKGGCFSFRSDVYSFGVLLLEIISGKKSNGSYSLDHSLNLVGYAWEKWTEHRISELIDQAMVLGGEDHAEAMKCIHVGLLCVQEGPEDRPTMSTVAAMISSEANELPKPKKPSFIFNDLQKGFEHDLEQGTLNDVSISDVEVR